MSRTKMFTGLKNKFWKAGTLMVLPLSQSDLIISATLTISFTSDY